MIIRDLQPLRLQLLRGFDERHRQPGLDVPFDMAVEQADPRIIGFESKDRIPASHDEERVAAHGDLGWWSGGNGGFGAVGGAGAGARDDLEVVGVEVEGMVASVVVDDCELHDGAVGEDEGVCVYAVDYRVGD